MKSKHIIFLSLIIQIFTIPKNFFPLFLKYKTQTSDKCVTFSCKENSKYCAESSGKDLKAILSPICKLNKEYCSLGDDPNIIFYNKKPLKAKCENYIIKKNIIRYPGEDCEENTDCSSNKCENKICSGIKLNNKCNSTDQCLKGLFCSSKTNRCEYQRNIFESCDNSFDCQNNLLCYNGLCQDVLYKFDIGTKIKDDSVSAEFYCKYGFAINGICAKNKYLDQSKIEDKFIKCNSNSDCKYRIYPENLGIIEKNCECGYNSNGDSYCPLDIDSNEIGWENYYKILKFKFTNDCHSFSRFKCYKNDIELLKMIKEIEDELKFGHRFYKSVDCAKKVFNEIN